MSIFYNAPLKDYMIHAIAENEGEYSYYLYIHSKSSSIIMRINSDETEIRYADAGFGGKNWSDRDTLDYKRYDELKN